ncbi:ferroxidase HEPHL1-like isoform X1 [Dreissena polymorpha]|uniref:ferroxidase HEPHL1-like isoform X1 n=1 Tax=Dreissena polymorpha TaxID=45954 RepID=UPI0022647AB2|nr:ferroxidase HEPHL1-like isoform X1 [Dreissena polymorpha]
MASADQNGVIGSGRVIRDYFIKAVKVDWDYLPLQMNVVDSYDTYWHDTLLRRNNRVGSKYWKYVYRRFTDDTFTTEITTPKSFGIVGPLLRGEVGDTIRVHFRNNVSVPLSVHPHGVQYTKLNEGALYQDNTSQRNKADESVGPGGSYVYTWEVTSGFAPRDGDPNCIPFGYHSHVNAEKETNAGLLGLLVICRSGILTPLGVRSDVDRELVLYFDSIDEGKSWLVHENLERCGDPAECKRLADAGDPDFEESLKKDSINGYMYGNLPELTVCAGDRVAWYIFSLSAELHPVNILGQTFLESGQRKAVEGIWSATFREAEMVARNPGRWLVQCMNSEHNRNGMKVEMAVEDCGKTVSDQLSGVNRKYFLKAETVDWNYAPSGLNKFYNDMPLDALDAESRIYFSKSHNGKRLIGGTYRKSQFVEYMTINYAARVKRTPEEEHLGILGPVIRAEVGDTITVILYNTCPHNVSIFLQGVSLAISQSGVNSKFPIDSTGNTGRIISPGENGTYMFTVPWAVAPGDDDPDCLTYIYHSNADMERDVSSGLVGPLLVCKPGTLDPVTGKQKYVDREMFLYLSSIDENYSWHIEHNVASYVNANVTSVDVTDEDFVESNIMRSVNGRSYGNIEGLHMCRDENVVWHMLSFGQTEGNHAVTFNGNNVNIDGINRDSHVIISGQGFSAVMKPINAGNWSVFCHNTIHYDAGMTALYHVDTCGASSPPFYQVTGKVRRYYIAAVELKWDYSPRTIHPIDESNYSDPSHAQHQRVEKGGKFVGSVYTKAVYREYTDATFLLEKQRGPEDIHLAVLGPSIKAEVGDTLIVVFKNAASRPYSIHAQGLLYNKSNEGMKYNDGQSMPVGDAVPPGTTFTYTWQVPSSSGPTNIGQNCINFMYHSAVDPVRDVYSGLASPIVVCRPGTLDQHGKRIDSVEKEFALLFLAFDENKSWYIQKNIKENCPQADTSSSDFIESNKYDSINALIYNNVEGLVAKSGDNIAWYIMGLGENEDLHTVHFHGHTYTYRTEKTHEGDVIEVFPGTYETVEMFVTSPGIWLLHCHVAEHMEDGMVATYTVIQ